MTTDVLKHFNENGWTAPTLGGALTFDDLARLDRFTEGSPTKPGISRTATALCPAHDDKNPSLSISETAAGELLLYCHAGCSFDAIRAALPARPKAPKRAGGGKRRIVATYPYTDEAGNLLFEVVRFHPKSFNQRRPDGNGGWIYKLGNTRRVLYGLQALIEADPEKRVFVCEGEKDANRLAALGLIATTNPTGANKWDENYSQSLKNRRVVIIEDNDQAGRKRTQMLTEELYGYATETRVIRFAGLPAGADISDWLDEDPTRGKAEVLALAEAAPVVEPLEAKRPRLKTSWTSDELLEAEFPEPTWAIPGFLCEGLTIFAGRPKLGKSWLALQWACAVGTGGRFFDQEIEPARVLYLALEDSARRIQKRQKAQRWPRGAKVDFETAWPDLLDGGLVELEARILADRPTLVIVDTLSRALRFKQKEVEDTTAALDPLQRLALDYGCSVVLVDHHRKPAGGVDDVINDVLGSTGKAAVADAIIGLYRDRGRQGATLKIAGRDLEEKELVVNFDVLTCSWQLLGDARHTPRTAKESEILEIIDALGQATTQQIADETGRAKGNVSRTLAAMLDRRLIIAGPKEGRSVPYRRGPLTT